MAKQSSLDALKWMWYSQESIKKAYDAIQSWASAKEAVALLAKEPEVTWGFQDTRWDVYKETADWSHQIDRRDNSTTRTWYYNDIAWRYVTSDEEIAASSNLWPATEVYYNDIAQQWLPVPQQPKAVRRQPKPQVNVPTVYSPYNTEAPVLDARVWAWANMWTTLSPYITTPMNFKEMEKMK